MNEFIWQTYWCYPTGRAHVKCNFLTSLVTILCACYLCTLFFAATLSQAWNFVSSGCPAPWLSSLVKPWRNPAPSTYSSKWTAPRVCWRFSVAGNCPRPAPQPRQDQDLSRCHPRRYQSLYDCFCCTLYAWSTSLDHSQALNLHWSLECAAF